MSPREAKKIPQIYRLRSDNFNSVTHWLQLDEGQLTIAQQKNGEPCEASVTIPRRVFDQMVDWYQRQQAPLRPPLKGVAKQG